MGLMSADETGPVPRGLLDRLAPRPALDVADLPGARTPGGSAAERLAADLDVLRDGGYLTLALPVRFGGSGLNLAEVACAQRQLAARAPAAAWALNDHHTWVGAAADALASGDVTDLAPGWVLGEVARGKLFTGHGAVRDRAVPIAGRRGARGTGTSTLMAGTYAWGLALSGMTSYA